MGRVVIVVDDEPGIVAVVSRMLTERGWTVHATHDATEVVMLATRVQPAVVLLDFVMPRLDGAAVIAALRKHAALRGVPVVLMSGLLESMVSRRTKHYAAFVRKPFTFDEVEGCLRRVAGRKR